MVSSYWICSIIIFSFLAPDSYPSSVELKLLNSTAAVVQWRKPNTLSLNGELTGYKVEIFTNNTLVTNFTLEPAATSLLLNNLTTGVIYTVRLAAFNRWINWISNVPKGKHLSINITGLEWVLSASRLVWKWSPVFCTNIQSFTLKFQFIIQTRCFSKLGLFQLSECSQFSLFCPWPALCMQKENKSKTNILDIIMVRPCKYQMFWYKFIGSNHE